MIHYDFEAFVRELPEGRAIMGIDLGTKNIGIAVSDVERKIATPYYTLRRKDQKKDMGRIWQVATERSVCGIVLGMPLNMDGSDGPRTQSTRAFARTLEMYMPKPLTFWDERLSTVFAERSLIEADTSRAKRELVIDKVAAAIILQGALDRIAFLYPDVPKPSEDDDIADKLAHKDARRTGEATPSAPDQDAEISPDPVTAGRLREGRQIPRARNAGGVDKAAADAKTSVEDAPHRDPQAVRRRRTMTRWIGRDE